MKLRLYIDGHLADLSDSSLIQVSHTAEDLTDPTIVKNSYSKQVTLEGTPTNNKLFGGIFRLDHITKSGFNPMRKTPFVIHDRTSQVVERGYLRLDSVEREGEKVAYKVTLFGGLGEFFYALAFDEEGNKRTLASLDYLGTKNPDDELSFNISRDVVDEAWSNLTATSGKWSVINFAPCYNGVPDDFAADKGIFKPEPMGLTHELTEGDATYTTVDGWALVELSEEYDEWQTRDLRSYLQRPVISLRAIVEAICKPTNNGGHTVTLDPAFFNDSNPYWSKAWITLPILNTIEQEQENNTYALKWSFDGLTERTEVNVNVGGSLIGGTSNAQVVIRPSINVASSAVIDGEVLSMATDRVLYRLKAYSDGVVIAQTDQKSISTNNTTADYLGAYDYDSESGRGLWNGEDVVLELDGIEGATRLTLEVVPSYTSVNGSAVVYDEDDVAVALDGYAGDAVDGLNYVTIESYIRARTGSLITKKMLLTTESSPADYLLSYCKLFGLHFIYDKATKAITIATRGTIYNGKGIDLTDRVDYGQKRTITPLPFDAKWYDFGFDYEEGAFAEYYAEAYGRPFGRQRINTGYEFNKDSKEILKDNNYKGAVELRERSKYFVTVEKSTGGEVPAVFLDAGHTYKLFAGSERKELDVPTPTSLDKITPWDAVYKTYDVTPKMQMHDKDNGACDIRDVLCFFRGYAKNPDSFILSDDLRVMGQLNDGEPCWVLNGKGSWRVIRIPSFGRYIYDGTTLDVVASWDFGTPAEIELPDGTLPDSANLYTRAWAQYLADRYNTDTKVVKCKVDFRGHAITADLLRNFYYFEGCWWVLNKINNYNLTDEDPIVECEFVRVHNKDNYKEGQKWQ